MHKNFKVKNNKYHEFIKLKYKCKLHLGKKKVKKKYNNMGCVVQDLIIVLALILKIDNIEKLWLNIYIYIYMKILIIEY